MNFNLQHYEIIVVTMDIEKDYDNICYDILKVQDTTSGYYLSFCGKSIEALCIHAYSSSVLITFTSDSSITGRGFQIYYATSESYKPENYNCSAYYTIGNTELLIYVYYLELCNY